MARPYSTPDVFRAIAHPLRREILFMLRKKGELAAGSIARQLPVQWTTVSRHLQALRLAGLVSAQRRGRELHYRAEVKALDTAMRWLKQIDVI